MNYVILDTEYTTWPGALENGWSKPDQDREIVQIAAILVNEDFEELYDIDVLVYPRRNPRLSKLFIELTGITQKQVNTQGAAFVYGYSRLRALIDDHPAICMNADEAVIRENCIINGLSFEEASYHRLRPFLETLDIDVASSGDLHTLTDRPLVGHTHNALHDVRSMAAWLGYAKRQGWFKTIDDLPTGAPKVDPRSKLIF